MSYLILVRHGQSVWNLENRFTGWVDVDLTENGKLEAKKSGLLIKNEKIKIAYYYCSLQLRAKNTLRIIQEEIQDPKQFTTRHSAIKHSGKLTKIASEKAT